MKKFIRRRVHVGLVLLCAGLLVTGLLPTPTLAQDADEDQDEQAQQLPEIAPREVEIRGELQLSFPTLERQPLRGFSSSPTLPSVPDERMPYVQPYKQELEDLPDSLPAATAVTQSRTTGTSPKRGFIEFGAGRYVSRFGKARLSLPVGSDQTVSLHTDYSGSRGFMPFSGTDVQTPYDEAEGTIRFESRQDVVTVAADIHGAVDNYTLYGIPAVRQNSSAQAPSRTGYSGGAAVELRSFSPIESTARVTLDRTQYNTQTALSPQASMETFQESRFAFDGSATVPIGITQTTVDAHATRSSFGGDVPESSGYTADGGISVGLMNTEFLTLHAGGHILSFSVPVDPKQTNGDVVQRSFLVPRGRLNLSLAPAVTVYAENSPVLESDGLSDLYTARPYVEHAPSLRPSVSTTKAEAGVILSLGTVRVRPVAGYEYFPSYRYVRSPDPATPPSTDPLQVEYASAGIARGGAELGLQGVNGVDASLSLFVRDGVLIGQNTAIPYFSPLVTDAMLSVSFADGSGLVTVTGTIESPRPTNLTDNSEVGTYTSFDMEASYKLSSLLDVVVQMKNLGPTAPELWAGYPQAPASIMGGFRIHW